MPTMTLTFSAANATRIVNALSVRYGYSPTLSDGTPNTQTPAEFVRLQVAQWLRNEVLAHESATAAAAAAGAIIPVDVT